MNKNKIAVFVMVVLMTASLFSGCTKNSTNDTPKVVELSGTININTQAGPGANEAWKAVYFIL